MISHILGKSDQKLKVKPLQGKSAIIRKFFVENLLITFLTI